MRRNAFAYAGCLAAVVVLGLASRRFPAMFPEALGKQPGDALWATAMYLSWCFLLRGARPGYLFLIAVAASWAVEFSQLYQADWINQVRSYRLGHLALGSHFHAMDLPAYVAGAGLGWLTDHLVLLGACRFRGSRR